MSISNPKKNVEVFNNDNNNLEVQTPKAKKSRSQNRATSSPRKFKKSLFNDTPQINRYKVQMIKSRTDACKNYRNEVRNILHKSDKFAIFQQKSSLTVPIELTPNRYILGKFCSQPNNIQKDQNITSKVTKENNFHDKVQNFILDSPQKYNHKSIEFENIIVPSDDDDPSKTANENNIDFKKQNTMKLDNFIDRYPLGKKKLFKLYLACEKQTNDYYFIWISLQKLSKCVSDSRQAISEKVEKLVKINCPPILKILEYDITDYYENLSLIIFSEYNPELTLRNINSNHKLSPTEKLIIIYGISFGMSKLHSQNIIHQQLIPDNILLGYKNSPKIIFLNFFDKNQKNKIKFNDSLNYQPPEYFQEKEFTKESDVYSFAMIAYEIITEKIPYESSGPFEVIASISQGKFPVFPPETPECYRQLIEMCWSHDPKERPSFDQIVNIIKDPEFLTKTSANVNEFVEYDNFINGISNEYENAETYKIYKRMVYNDCLFKFKECLEDSRLDFDRPFSIDKVSVDLSLFTKHEKIGEGGYGKIYRIQNKENENFAAKVSKKAMSCDDFIKESNELMYMIGFKHPSIIKFIGFSPKDFKSRDKPVIITEYAQNGSLDHILKQEHKTLSTDSWNSTKKLICIYGIASAMSYLHSNNVLHLDLKAGNVLVDSSFYPKLSDFGLSLQLPNAGGKTKFEIKGTPLHIAPEIWSDSLYSKAADVYAFGLTVFEIMANTVPFEDIKNIYQLINEVIIKKRRPELNSSVPKCYQKLIEDCWSHNPEDRPTFDDIVSLLKSDKSFIIDASVDENEFEDFVSFVETQDIQDDSECVKVLPPDDKVDFDNVSHISDVLKKCDCLASSLKLLKDIDKTKAFKSIPPKSCTYLLQNKVIFKNKSNDNQSGEKIIENSGSENFLLEYSLIEHFLCGGSPSEFE